MSSSPSATSLPTRPRYWLMKAEPDSRVVKGKDVKFSVDDFAAIGTSQWDGVRNYQARNYMQKDMSVGDQVLFYHSNCKNPGIAGFAEVSRDAYPDYTAWDESHPYYDPNSTESNPRWFMVDVTFKRKATNFVSLAVLKWIATLKVNEAKEGDEDGNGPASPVTSILSREQILAIQAMPLLSSSRLSIQPVSQGAWDAIHELASLENVDDLDWFKSGSSGGSSDKKKKTREPRKGKRKHNDDNGNDNAEEDGGEGRRRKSLRQRK